MKFRVPLLSLFVAAVGLTVAPIATPQSKATSSTTVAVTMGKPTEFHILLSKKTVPHGTVVFKVTNKGKLSHDFKIGAKKTPLLKPGKSASITVTLKAGSWPYKCTVAGHASYGMKGVLKAT